LRPALVVTVNVAAVPMRFGRFGTWSPSSVRTPRCSPRLLALLVAASAALAGCGRSSPPRESPIDELETTLTPAAFARALRRSGGHFHAVTTLDIGPTGAAGQAPSARDAVTTTTDIWMDKAGHYRLLETNDRDGGREVVVFGKDLAVGLRYGRLIKRPVQEPEATRFLEEGLGGPIAAWEIARRFAEAARRDEGSGNAATSIIEVTKASEPQSVKAELETASGLQKWRDSVNVDTLAGQVRIAEGIGAAIKVNLEAHFGLTRENTPMNGIVKVAAELTELGKVAPHEPPQAEELQVRQRTVLEEKALLGRTGGEGAHK
jgi:hypothetical protein